MENQITIHETTTPDKLLALAIDKDLDIEKLAKLMELQKQWKADEAKKLFFESLSEFQFRVPELRKSKKVLFDTKNGKTEYHYAPLADIVRQIKPYVKECQLAYRWEIKDSKEEITVSCLVTHTEGHTEVTTMSASADHTGSKNAIQARGSTIEYLKRYTIIGALGLSTADSDVDGQIPEISVDILHKQYMEHFNELSRIDSKKYAKWHPDEWANRGAKVYIKAIAEIRSLLAKLKPAEA